MHEYFFKKIAKILDVVLKKFSVKMHIIILTDCKFLLDNRWLSKKNTFSRNNIKYLPTYILVILK